MSCFIPQLIIIFDLKLTIFPTHIFPAYTKAKLSGSNRAGSIVTVAEDILASCSFESTIKFWDFKNNENYLLNIQDHNPIALDEVVSCINYCTDKGIIRF